MTKKNASSTLYFILFFIIFLAFCAFAVDGTIVFTNRAKLQSATETTAMAAASEFNSDSNPNTISATDINQVNLVANSTFNLLKADNLQTAKIVVDTSAPPKVTITAKMISRPYFLAFLGVSGINLEAKASAQSESVPIMVDYGTVVNWITANAAWHADILSKNLNFNDTAILKPLGDSASASYFSGSPNLGLIRSSDDHPLSLGPGGFITIRLPVPIVNKTGYDLYIKESGHLEGYMVFAGLDVNPDNPYTQSGNEGDGIYWVNISCTGDPEVADSNGGVGAYTVNTDNLGTQTRFYGSANFDIGKTCTDGFQGLSMVKYIRIVDDNSESAFVNVGGNAYTKAMLYGEASSVTPGADIDAVTILNHVRLVK